MTDRTVSHELTRGTHRGVSDDLSNVGLAGLGLTVSALYLLGARGNNAQQHDTALLASRAAFESLTITQVFNLGFRRARPNSNRGTGKFFESGGRSFPSNHAALAFSIATVLAHKYPEPKVKVLSYGTAAAISALRISAGKHFTADVLAGGALGYFIGRNVLNDKSQRPNEKFGSFVQEQAPLQIESMSSSYVELDSWIYPAVERLSALGLIQSGFLGMRPWTRLAVYRMLADLDPSGVDDTASALVASVLDELKQEKMLDDGSENKQISVDRIYSRTQYISNDPLSDSYHFGQTIVNDFGRPYSRGAQQLTGIQSRAEHGRFSFFFRGEYQHSPHRAGYSSELANIVATQDRTPVQSFNGTPSQNAFRLLDTYVSLKLLGNEISIGKQSYWWGPAAGSAMVMSNNAEPLYSLRISRSVPFEIPLLSRLVGPVRYDNFFAKLSGHKYPSQPFFYAQKVSFKPTENLELGFSRNAVFAGQGVQPLTFGNFFKSFTSTSSGTEGNWSARTGPGARHSGFDFSYRLPKLRDKVTLYTDSIVHDDVSPLAAPRRAAVTTGIYIAKLPGTPKLDFHVEGGTTDTVTNRAKGGQFYYWEQIYRDAYTNKGYLLGSWLGREGTGGQAWITYWFDPKNTLRVGYRTLKVSHYFVPKGETQQDGYADLQREWRNGFAVRCFLQVERWAAPALAPNPQKNVTAQVELSFHPKILNLGRPNRESGY